EPAVVFSRAGETHAPATRKVGQPRQGQDARRSAGVRQSEGPLAADRIVRVRRRSGGREARASARPVHDDPIWFTGLRGAFGRACARRRTRYHHYASDVGKYSGVSRSRLIEGRLMSHKPRIAVILDENTSVDGTRYEATKGLFSAIRDAGGLPFG